MGLATVRSLDANTPMPISAMRRLLSSMRFARSSSNWFNMLRFVGWVYRAA